MTDSKKINWKKINKLREIFLASNDSAREKEYWSQDSQLLRDYDRTLGQRICWKWQSVIREERFVSQHPEFFSSVRRIIDFGCGTGAAISTLLSEVSFSDRKVDVVLVDQSTHAMQYTREKIEPFKSVKAISTNLDFRQLKPQPGDLVLLSHVLNELPAKIVNDLIDWLKMADQFVWVEAGSKEVSYRLSKIHNEVRTSHRIVSPCPHQNACPLIGQDEGGDWCHFFATVPQEAFTSAFWREFANQCGVDLSSLPYSSLIASRAVSSPEDGEARIIGKPKLAKAYIDVLNCSAEGVSVDRVEKNRDKELFKALRKQRTYGFLPNRR